MAQKELLKKLKQKSPDQYNFVKDLLKHKLVTLDLDENDNINIILTKKGLEKWKKIDEINKNF